MDADPTLEAGGDQVDRDAHRDQVDRDAIRDQVDRNPVGAGTTRRRRIFVAAGLVAAGAVGGGLIALAAPASAEQSSGTPAAAAPSGSPSDSGGPGRHQPGGQSSGGAGGGQRAGETLLTGSDAEKARAAALAAVPGATVDRVETDADGAVYEAHITRSDGSRATVKFDQDFTVTGVQTGPGQGPPASK